MRFEIYLSILQIKQFRRILEEVPRISSKKHVHDLLSAIKETNRLREKATEKGEMVVNNTTSQDSIQNSTTSVIKVIKDTIYILFHICDCFLLINGVWSLIVTRF